MEDRSSYIRSSGFSSCPHCWQR